METFFFKLTKIRYFPQNFLFLLFLLFLVSEGLLFVSFFWTSFHSLSSSSFGDWTGFYVPDPCELTFANTLLLSNAAISLGNAIMTQDRWMQLLSWSLSRYETQDIKTQPKFNHYVGWGFWARLFNLGKNTNPLF